MFAGVDEIDTSRTNALQTVWLTVPSLKTMSWSVLWNCLDLRNLHTNRKHLLQMGVPDYLLEFS